MPVQCWPAVCDAGPTLYRHWVNVSFLLGWAPGLKLVIILILGENWVIHHRRFQLYSFTSCLRKIRYTVDLVIFACLNFREFLILGLFTKFRMRELIFIFSSDITIIICMRFLNSQTCPREIHEK